MTRRLQIPDLGRARAIILHRPHPVVASLTRQLEVIGLLAEPCWPELSPAACGADYLFLDVDTAHADQFPWPAGQSPMPTIALIGSEAPGRIEWLMNFGADAQMLKPIGTSGVYSALLIARATFDVRAQLADRIDTLQRRLGQRQTVVRAVTLLAARGRSDDAAYDQLRAMAMAWRISFEEAAERIVAASQPDRRDHG